MAHSFSVVIPAGMDIAAGIELVRAGIAAEGGTYQFDGTNGSFSVKGVSGTFTVSGQTVVITINKKPFIVSHGFVEGKIREYFA